MDIFLMIGVSFIIGVFLIAFIYSSVGHGGASGYLALMVLFGMSTTMMRPSALLLNLFVAGIAFYNFYRGGHFNWRLFLPFAIVSIPMAFIGGTIRVDPIWYKWILAIFLVIATLRIIGVIGNREKDSVKKINLPVALGIGAVIGLISGMIGIGGGIILTPIILLLNWGKIKEAAAVSALFIFVNSASGLSGWMINFYDWAGGFPYSRYPESYPIVIAAIIGGLAGSYYGSIKYKPILVRKLLAAVLVFASIKLIVF